MTHEFDGRRGACRRGFTLAEVLVASTLLVIGFVALVAAFGRDSEVTQHSADVTTATFLADEIHSMALQAPFAGLSSLGGLHNPAVLSDGTTQGQTKWAQFVTVTNVDESDLGYAPSGPVKAVRLTVDVRALGESVLTQTYYIFDMTGVPTTAG
jgi:prepilin-type N-terminal cleavage/methylation domain-containing protein